MKIKHFLEKLCFATFIITAITSIPLLFNYFIEVSPKFQLIVDLHVWFGTAFIIFVLIRIVKNKKFVKAIWKGVIKMDIKNIKSKVEFSSEKACKKDILKSEKFNIVIVGLEKNQEIKPHPEPYAVFFFVLEGKGTFTNKEGEKTLNKGDSIFMNLNETRGIKCIEKLTILGVQDGH